jgi:HK97 family phage prohead protease
MNGILWIEDLYATIYPKFYKFLGDKMQEAEKMSRVIEKLGASLSVSNNEDHADCSCNDEKAEVRKDVFTTEEEAVARAKEIGCNGFHTMEEDGETIYMPCSNHDDYAEATDRETSGYGYGMGKKPKKKKPKKKDEDLGSLNIKTDLKSIDSDSKEYGYFKGYGSVFGNTDLGNDVIEKGAFRKSLENREAREVKLLYQHKSDMPIGVFDSIEEDNNGLLVEGRLALKTQAGQEAYELLKMGALDGLSIGFKVNPKKVSYEDRGQKRILKEVDLMEVSLVTFPMNPQATVTQVKGRDLSVREWEYELRDAFQLSRSEAKVAATAVHKSLSGQREVSKEKVELVDAINKLNINLKNLINRR